MDFVVTPGSSPQSADLMAEPQGRIDVPESEIIKALNKWQTHRDEWGPCEASQHLKYPRGTLIGWRNKYSDPSLTKDPAPHRPANRLRTAGAGRKRKVPDYENSVLDYYTECIRQDGKVTNQDILSYCHTKPEFILKSDGAQNVWVSLVMARNKDIVVPPQDVDVAESPAAAGQDGTTAPEPAIQQTSDISCPEKGEDIVGEQGTRQTAAGNSARNEAADAVNLVEGNSNSGGGNQTLIPLKTLQKLYSLRDRDKSAKFLFRYLNEEKSTSSAQKTVGIYADDLFSVELCQPLTNPFTDFVIYKGLTRGKGSVFFFFWHVTFLSIDHIDQSEKSFSGVKELVDKVDFKFFPFVLILFRVMGIGACLRWRILCKRQLNALTSIPYRQSTSPTTYLTWLHYTSPKLAAIKFRSKKK
ncbi:unnamed protein product [Phytophthora fragariaefolia]|uniref:Unnamed protein product n=1 Tax=Phytophthora fragariaefolia TaxID=1490495 RepID=A0A9W6Y001_9STRA|nr:unnamed protein product [Phytophthora fragariaefolia]